MKTKKGFAISAILYSIIVIAILVFFLVLALNKNTVLVNDQFITTIKEQLNLDFMEKNPTPYVAFEFDLSLGEGYVNIYINDLQNTPVYVYLGNYATNSSKIEDNFSNPDFVWTDLTDSTDLRSKLGVSSGIYTVIATKMTRTRLSNPNSYSNPALIGVPHFDLIGLNTYSIAYLFKGADSFNQDLNDWDTTNITDMNNVFYGASLFNGNISSWNTSNVRYMNGLFRNATNFNSDISSWDTGKVREMSYIFGHAENFNQDIGSWDTSNVTRLSDAFYYAKKFNQDLNNWDTSKVTTLSRTFYRAEEFNGDISSWNTSNVTTLNSTFMWNPKFNGDIGAWDTSNVTDMYSTFTRATSFNQNINNWDTSKVKNMFSMFSYAESFNQPLNNWDVSNVTDIGNMFRNAINFNQPLNNWDVSSVTTLARTFQAARAFNQPLNNWNVSNVTNMTYMFSSNNVYSQNLTGWCVNNIATTPTSFSTSSFPTVRHPKWGTCPNKMTYLVKFNLSNGSGSAPDQLILHGNKATAPSNPTRSGYTFGGWSPSIGTTITNDTTFVAVWNRIPTYSITYFYAEWDFTYNYYDRIDSVPQGSSYTIVSEAGATRYYDWTLYQSTGQKVYYNVGSTYTINKSLVLMNK